MFEKIIDIQRVGRFEKLLTPSKLRFSKITLIFGENGWGKSTIADIFRSYGSNRPEIVRGRETLSTTGEQKVILLYKGNQAICDGIAWTGQPSPSIAVFDQTFINENVYSGENVSHDHLKKQYGLVLGVDGVKLLQDIQATENDEQKIKLKIKEQERAIQNTIFVLGLQKKDVISFVSLTPLERAKSAIQQKETELKRAIEWRQIESATLPEPLPLPTSAGNFKATLTRSIEGVATEARMHVHRHIASHAKPNNVATNSHEVWLESGLSFSSEESCPFCGQDLVNRTLLDHYSSYFSKTFKALSEEVQNRRKTIARYENKDFRKAITTQIKANKAATDNLSKPDKRNIP